MNLAVEMGSDIMIYIIASFIKIGSGIRTLIEGDLQTRRLMEGIYEVWR
jgi:hypothetical protein